MQGKIPVLLVYGLLGLLLALSSSLIRAPQGGAASASRLPVQAAGYGAPAAAYRSNYLAEFSFSATRARLAYDNIMT